MIYRREIGMGILAFHEARFCSGLLGSYGLATALLGLFLCLLANDLVIRTWRAWQK